MAKTKEQKKAILERLDMAVKTSPSTVFVHFKGLPVGEETALRGGLREEGVSYFVARKTLMKRALDSAGIEGDQPELEGEMAVAYGSDDPTAPARNVHTFVKKYGDKLAIVGGVFEGRFMDATEMNEVATIPPVDTLRGMFANVINSPIQGLVIALNSIAEKKEA
ncbi:50S ribosomal protein L10 [bacterium]|nr:50S ribosomal protein L10 [bacterium]|tara:strand:- start:3479 stop:3973 length:495 start_codon:yes stop_codon:yes gene_type:complete